MKGCSPIVQAEQLLWVMVIGPSPCYDGFWRVRCLVCINFRMGYVLVGQQMNTVKHLILLEEVSQPFGHRN